MCQNHWLVQALPNRRARTFSNLLIVTVTATKRKSGTENFIALSIFRQRLLYLSIMTKKLLFGSLLLLLFIAQSCSNNACGSSKDDFLANYADLLETVNRKDLAVSDGQWTKYDERFRAMVEECYATYEPEMSGREKRRFWRQAMQYYVVRYGEGVSKELFGKKREQSVFEKVKERLRELE